MTELSTILPVSLEVLHLTSVTSLCVRPLLILAAQRSKLPRLGNVVTLDDPFCEGSIYDEFAPAADETGLQEVYDEAGIVLWSTPHVSVEMSKTIDGWYEEKWEHEEKKMARLAIYDPFFSALVKSDGSSDDGLA